MRAQRRHARPGRDRGIVERGVPALIAQPGQLKTSLAWHELSSTGCAVRKCAATGWFCAEIKARSRDEG